MNAIVASDRSCVHVREKRQKRMAGVQRQLLCWPMQKKNTNSYKNDAFWATRYYSIALTQ